MDPGPECSITNSDFQIGCVRRSKPHLSGVGPAVDLPVNLHPISLGEFEEEHDDASNLKREIPVTNVVGFVLDVLVQVIQEMVIHEIKSVVLGVLTLDIGGKQNY